MAAASDSICRKSGAASASPILLESDSNFEIENLAAAILTDDVKLTIELDTVKK